MHQPDALRRIAAEAAHVAGQRLRDIQHEARDITRKGHLDIVTDADLTADRLIQQTIHAHRPDHAILSEESEAGAQIASWQPPQDGYYWIIDPLDGTNNYARGNPSWSVSVAVAYGGDLLAGAVYDPTRDDLYSAGRGVGAWCNDRALHVQPTDLEWAALAADWPTHPPYRQLIWDMAETLIGDVRTLRCWGTTALALAHVAAGYLDIYLHRGFKIWDVAAGVLLIQEAGGRVTCWDGRAWGLTDREMLASNAHLHDTALARIAPLLPR